MEDEELRDLGPVVIGSGRGRQDKEAIAKLSFTPPEIEELSQVDFRASVVVAAFLRDIALGRVDELFRNLTVAQDSILVGDEVPS